MASRKQGEWGADQDRAREMSVDRDSGRYGGRTIARRIVSADGFTILVGKKDADNDLLTFKLGRPNDIWLHVAGTPGSHVLVLNPGSEARVPRATLQLAAGLAAGYSKQRRGGRTAVHMALCRDVSKPRGAAPGKVALRRFETLRELPVREEDL